MTRDIHLLFDCTYIKNNCVGIALYAINLLKGLAQYPQIRLSVLFFEDGPYTEFEKLVGRKLDFILIKHHFDMRPTFLSHKFDRIRRRVPFENELERRGINRVFTPFLSYSSFVYPLKYRQITTIHDLQNLKLARQKGIKCYLKEWLGFKNHINKIPHLITISKTIQKGLWDNFKKESTLIYNSIPPLGDTGMSSGNRINGKYILDINRFYLYKNAETLIRAYALIEDKIPHLLYLKGSEEPEEDYLYLKDLVRSLRLEEKIVLDVNDYPRDELVSLISHADLFVSPSRWEGFGFTPIEAAILKVPVIVSNIDTLMEVTKGKLASFDPDSPQELAEKMLSVLSSPPSEEELSSTSSFFLEEYSIKRQTKEFVHLLLNT